jgi:hypothetical protein
MHAPLVRLKSETVGSRRKLFVLSALACIFIGLLGPLVQRGGWVWTECFVPFGLVLLFLWVFRIRRTGTMDFDSDRIHVRGVFVDHRVGWDEVEKFEVRTRSGDGMTFYRPTVCLVSGKSFWIYGFTSQYSEKAKATVFRLNAEMKKHRKTATNGVPYKGDVAEGSAQFPRRSA